MNFFKKLINNNTGVSSKNFFLVTVTIIGCLLLLVPAVTLIVEIIFNHAPAHGFLRAVAVKVDRQCGIDGQGCFAQGGEGEPATFSHRQQLPLSFRRDVFGGVVASRREHLKSVDAELRRFFYRFGDGKSERLEHSPDSERVHHFPPSAAPASPRTENRYKTIISHARR